jgi:hypothetical protein
VDFLIFESADTPDWEDPVQFETLAFPRRSVAQLAKRLALEALN